MYLQKSFKLFESVADSISEYNSKYAQLIDILQYEVFDEFNILKQTDETFEGEEVLHKFWCFYSSIKKPGTFSEIPSDRKIENIYVYNISLKECPEFEAKLDSIVPLVQNYLDMDLGYTAEEYNDDYWDYIIKLVDIK